MIILIFFDFGTNTPNFNSSKIIVNKVNFFISIKKWNVWYKTAYIQYACKMPKYFRAWLCNSQKTSKGDDITSYNTTFGISNCHA